MPNNEPFSVRSHFVAPYFLNPVHRIRVDLVGAGGSGSQMLSSLARINAGLTALGGTGLHVRVYDPDTVDEANIGRQLFSRSELGMNKAVALVTRFNRFHGTDWDAVPGRYAATETRQNRPNIIVSCVDNIAARRTVSSIMHEYMRDDGTSPEYTTYYWLDLGNARRTGQAVLGSIDIPQPDKEGIRKERLPFFSDEYDLDSIHDEDSGPSCSMEEALARQDLFVNSSIAQFSGSLLWTLLREGRTECRGFYLNLETLSAAPIPV